MKKLLAAALVAVCASAAWAQKKETGNSSFDALDRNRDGFLSKEEIAGDKELAKRFARFDADKDGRWNVNEFVKANQDNDERILADSAITAKVKAMLLAEKGVPSTSISVETYEGRVLLSGFVDSEAIREKAAKVAAGVSGAKHVQNHLVVK
ncbi:MAG TPA: BON domain-containing protein [Burkholderiales bacterium]|nr:BON domain-containing protein [Burkholderiales bacterium]